jgi:Ala-tRNA(Pro) deacylase
MILERVQKYLNDHGIAFDAQYQPEGLALQASPDPGGVVGSQPVMVVVVVADFRPLMLVLDAARSLELEHLGLALGIGETVVQFADAEYLARTFPDCDFDAIPPFGNLYGMDVYSDDCIGRSRMIVFSCGTHHTTVRMQCEDFVRVVRPRVVRLA